MDFNKNAPIWRQLRNLFAISIANGVWMLGAQIPSVRELAAEYGVNPNTIQKALSELEAEGCLETRRGLGRYVTENKVLVSRLRFEVAAEAAEKYVEKMHALGLTEKDACELIAKEWQKKNDFQRMFSQIFRRNENEKMKRKVRL
ncbi:GntR family transcriptional regulator [Arcanobacterium hippocoleae]